MKKCLIFVLAFFLIAFSGVDFCDENRVFAVDTNKKYYTIYSDESKKEVLFLKGDEVVVGDKYLSSDNKLYEIESVDDKTKTGYAKFLKDEKLPKFNVKPKQNATSAKAASKKKVGVYHTHNDECYFTPDGVDSVYGKGGIHDVGAKFVENLKQLGITALYREDLHLPHNSGAYTRSQVTATALLNEGVDAIFDLHRDSTKRDYYLTNVNGKQMSSIRMVVGAASANFEENKNFAYSIKGYADEAYPGLIKDIYIGKGNYNQQLSNRAMLFEMGCENIEKDLVFASTECLAKTMDVVLYGKDGASELALADVSLDENATLTVLVASNDASANSNQTLWVVLGVIGTAVLIFAGVLIFSEKARYKVGRLFSEMFAGIFGKKKTN